MCSCNGAVSVSVEWDLACCLECGACYSGFDFPADRVDLERLLLQRPGKYRLWNTPGAVTNGPLPETVASLAVENVKFGWPVPDDVVDMIAEVA